MVCGALRRYGDLNDWDVLQVTSMESLVRNCEAVNDCIDRWEARRVDNDAAHVGRGSGPPLAAWDVRRVTDLGYMFHRAYRFNQPLEAWDVRVVRCMEKLCSVAVSFHRPLFGWTTRHDVSVWEARPAVSPSDGLR